MSASSPLYSPHGTIPYLFICITTTTTIPKHLYIFNHHFYAVILRCVGEHLTSVEDEVFY